MELLAQGMPLAFAAWVFTLGAVIGSFLNVVIARVPKGESVVRPASRCPRCKSAIRWYDNIPIVSWLVLRGKCRDCALPISPRYPLVELLVALLAVAAARQLGPTWTALAYFVFAAALVALAYIDLDTWLLPAEITYPLIALGLVSPLWNHALSFRDALIGGAAGFGLFAAIALFGEKVLKKEVMGWGDVYLLAGIGAWLGWQALLPVVLLSALQGAAVGIVLLLLGKTPDGQTPATVVQPEPDAVEDDWVPPKNAVPYGPFLALAALEYLLAGARIVSTWDSVLQRIFG
ncbi:MAG TPA: prepilin peptidase [Myxococcales bacterium]|nr:prepilin peptidase [Myxococcales bacterium]